MNILTSVLRRFRAVLSPEHFPRQVVLQDFDPDGVRFEVTNAVEAYRVERHGGETEYVAQMLDRLSSHDVLYDIGACVGLVALHAARRCRRVIAFEPEPSFRKRLHRNLELNPDIHLAVESIAICDQDGVATLFTDGVAGNSPSLRHQRGEQEMIEVPCRSLDSLRKEGALPRATAIKLDIEGAEMLALTGGRELLGGKDAPRLVFVEVHPDFLPEFGATAEDVSSVLNDAGYHIAYEARRQAQIHYIYERGS